MNCAIANLPPLLFRKLGLPRFQHHATRTTVQDRPFEYSQEQDTLQRSPTITSKMPNIDLSSLKLLDRHIEVIHKRAEGQSLLTIKIPIQHLTLL